MYHFILQTPMFYCNRDETKHCGFVHQVHTRNKPCTKIPVIFLIGARVCLFVFLAKFDLKSCYSFKEIDIDFSKICSNVLFKKKYWVFIILFINKHGNDERNRTCVTWVWALWFHFILNFDSEKSYNGDCTIEWEYWE